MESNIKSMSKLRTKPKIKTRIKSSRKKIKYTLKKNDKIIIILLSLIIVGIIITTIILSYTSKESFRLFKKSNVDIT